MGNEFRGCDVAFEFGLQDAWFMASGSGGSFVQSPGRLFFVCRGSDIDATLPLALPVVMPSCTF